MVIYRGITDKRYPREQYICKEYRLGKCIYESTNNKTTFHWYTNGSVIGCVLTSINPTSKYTNHIQEICIINTAGLQKPFGETLLFTT